MDFKQVQTFVTLSKYLHFGQAAEALNIAQPHVSRRIKQLEEELGVQLLYRDKRNVSLTEPGEVFLKEAQTLLRDIDLAKSHTRESALGRRGKLDITLVGAAMLGRLPMVLRDFRRRYPNVHLNFKEMGSTAQIEALSQGAADVSFFHEPMRATAPFGQLLIQNDPLVAVLPADHRLADRTEMDLIELAPEPWVMFPREESSPIYDRIISLCTRVGFSPRIAQEAGPVHTRLGLVASGFGVHLVGQSWRSNPYPGIVYIPVKPTASVALLGYWRKNDPNIILKLFLDVLKLHQV